MSRTPAQLVLVLAAALVSASAAAQTPPARPSAGPAADAASDAQKAAFLALPLATRVEAQDALVWLGLYNGAADGAFGKRTRNSIAAFQLSQKATGDGVLSLGQLQALIAAGQKARVAAGFKTIADPSTGARIGAPAKLIDAKGGVTLDFASDASGDLAALYARLSADSPTRKVAYKAMKPGAFFVVSGEDRGRKFYTRYDFERRRDPADPRLHLRLPRNAKRSRSGRARRRQFFSTLPSAGSGGGCGRLAPRASRAPCGGRAARARRPVRNGADRRARARADRA